jgi:putative oxidoreductase
MATLELVRRESLLEKNAALLPVRASLGATMVHHGWSKLHGEGPQKSAEMMEKLHLRPAKPMAILTGAAELFAGVSTLLGVATRPAALGVLVTQGVAIWKVHAKNGFDITKGGYEFNAALIAIASALLISGPGRLSAHEGLEHLAEGRTRSRRWLRKARPTLGVRLLKWLK